VLFLILKRNKVEPKQTETGKNEDQQGQKGQIRVKKSETQ
jgi:hypothetical protein